MYPEEHFQAYPDDTSRILWAPTTATEIRRFAALHLLTKIIQKRQVLQYWSTDALLQTKVFNQIMFRNRFQKILQFLHVADDYNHDATDPSTDKSFKVRAVAEFLVDRFKTVYTASENILIDEELLLYKGKLAFKQYIPSKKARFGINLWRFWISPELFRLCWWNTMNENQHQLERKIGKSDAVVTSLVNDLLGLSYKLLVANWYTSEALFDYFS